jgi:hypothetical protein
MNSLRISGYYIVLTQKYAKVFYAVVGVSRPKIDSNRALTGSTNNGVTTNWYFQSQSSILFTSS